MFVLYKQTHNNEASESFSVINNESQNHRGNEYRIILPAQHLALLHFGCGGVHTHCDVGHIAAKVSNDESVN